MNSRDASHDRGRSASDFNYARNSRFEFRASLDLSEIGYVSRVSVGFSTFVCAAGSVQTQFSHLDDLNELVVVGRHSFNRFSFGDF